MIRARNVVATVTVSLLGLVLVPISAAPAAAVGDNCASTELATRCASMERGGDDITALGTVDGRRGKVRVRVVRVTLQHLTPDRWVNVSSSEPPDKLWIGGYDSLPVAISCDSAADGKFRATTTVQWKLGPGGKVRTGRVTSDPVRKSRLCD